MKPIYKLFKTTKIIDVWNELGIPIPPRSTYIKEEVSKALKKTGYLKQKEIDQHPDLPSRPTVLKLFKTTSMANVWKELNIKTPQRKKSKLVNASRFQ